MIDPETFVKGIKSKCCSAPVVKYYNTRQPGKEEFFRCIACDKECDFYEDQPTPESNPSYSKDDEGKIEITPESKEEDLRDIENRIYNSMTYNWDLIKPSPTGRIKKGNRKKFAKRLAKSIIKLIKIYE